MTRSQAEPSCHDAWIRTNVDMLSRTSLRLRNFRLFGGCLARTHWCACLVALGSGPPERAARPPDTGTHELGSRRVMVAPYVGPSEAENEVWGRGELNS